MSEAAEIALSNLTSREMQWAYRAMSIASPACSSPDVLQGGRLKYASAALLIASGAISPPCQFAIGTNCAPSSDLFGCAFSVNIKGYRCVRVTCALTLSVQTVGTGMLSVDY